MRRNILAIVLVFAGSFYVGGGTLSFAQTKVPAAADSSRARQRAPGSTADTASSARDRDYLPKWYSMITDIPPDWLQYANETFRLENVPAIAGMVGLTAVLIITDDRTYALERRWYGESPAFHRVTDLLTFTGDGRFQFGIVGAFAAYGFAFNDARSIRTASQTTEAILACGGVVQLLKHITGRESPYVATKPGGAWRFFPNQIDYASHVPHYDAFPSGHIATAMTTLVVIAENYPEVVWLRPAGYVALAAISSSLVASGVHWWSDIPLGLALGYAFGEIASHPEGIRICGSGAEGTTGISLVPVAGPFRNGLELRISLAAFSSLLQVSALKREMKHGL